MDSLLNFPLPSQTSHPWLYLRAKLFFKELYESVQLLLSVEMAMDEWTIGKALCFAFCGIHRLSQNLRLHLVIKSSPLVCKDNL